MKFAIVLFLSTLAVFAQQRRAPGFSLPDTNITRYDLQDYRGKVVLIEFLRTECPMCRALTKALAEVADKFGDKVQILYIVTPPDTQATVAEYIAAQPIHGPVLFDCGQVTASYTETTPQNPTIHLPHFYIIDGNGFIRAHSSADGNPGELLSKWILAQVEAVLKSVPAK